MADMALHTTGDVEGALRNVRQLLKPGGRLIGFENINNDAVHLGIGMGGFAAWWSGAEHGVDTHTFGHNHTRPMCVCVFMGRNDLVALLRERLTVLPKLQLKQQQSLVFVGGKTMATMDLLQKASSFVTPFYRKISHIRAIEALNDVTDEQSPESSSVSARWPEDSLYHRFNSILHVVHEDIIPYASQMSISLNAGADAPAAIPIFRSNLAPAHPAAGLDAAGKSATVSLSSQLQRVTSKEKALKVITEVVTLKLKKELSTPPDTEVLGRPRR
ncbi:uncharacterized protein FTOL_01628 [Fusarium torulosum]|uniref:Polyketide synthase n=1 Tax=Fusarium torulosum TaxID=33205 RepID=A0AAE8M0B3_9HYPO|nr:uncharacterized protein FTOL_01628 [Fusarium torulosum]